MSHSESPAVPAGLRIQLQLNESDLVILHKRVLAKLQLRSELPQLILNWIVVYPLLPFIPFVLTGNYWHYEMLIGYGTMLVFGVWLTAKTYRVFAGNLKKWLASDEARRHMVPTSLIFTPEGIIVQSHSANALVRWTTVANIERAADRTYLWVSKSNAYVVPRRFFRDDHEYDSLLNYICNCRAACPLEPMTCPRCGYDLRGSSGSGCPECGWQRESASADTQTGR